MISQKLLIMLVAGGAWGLGVVRNGKK